VEHGAQKIKGYRPEEIIGKNFACFYTAEDVAAGKPQRNLREVARRGCIRDQGPPRPQRRIDLLKPKLY
jgi:hypothetical protein